VLIRDLTGKGLLLPARAGKRLAQDVKLLLTGSVPILGPGAATVRNSRIYAIYFALGDGMAFAVQILAGVAGERLLDLCRPRTIRILRFEKLSNLNRGYHN
jgi:hypothetical protein